MPHPILKIEPVDLSGINYRLDQHYQSHFILNLIKTCFSSRSKLVQAVSESLEILIDINHFKIIQNDFVDIFVVMTVRKEVSS